MSFTNPKHIHCIGIGGIHVSAVAKLLQARGVSVSGSDAVENEMTSELQMRGINVTIGHDASNVPAGCDVVVYSDAVPEDNVERVEASRRNTPSFDTHTFLGQLFRDAKQIVVTGTHGKSTTTAMIGKIFIKAGKNPTIVIGTKVDGFSDGNLHIGSKELLIVEGDEFRSHVLAYHPTLLVITNIDWDHPDVFPTPEAYTEVFRRAIQQIKPKGTLVTNIDEPDVVNILNDKSLWDEITSRHIRLQLFGFKPRNHDMWSAKPSMGSLKTPGYFPLVITHHGVLKRDFQMFGLRIPGFANGMNATAAALAAISMNIDREVLGVELSHFRGCWRRFERVGDWNGCPVISDYGHHPTEVYATLDAAHQAYPDKRVVLCFQPHQRARTKGLLDSFPAAFDEADVLILSEIYEVPGRETSQDQISSKDILELIEAHDAKRGVDRPRLFAPDLDRAEVMIKETAKPGDVILVMGAGTIDQVARNLCSVRAG